MAATVITYLPGFCCNDWLVYWSQDMADGFGYKYKLVKFPWVTVCLNGSFGAQT